MRYIKVSDTLKKCLTLFNWWFWTVIGLRPVPVAAQKVSDAFPRKSVRHFSRFGKCLTLLVVGTVWGAAAGVSQAGERLEQKTVKGGVVSLSAGILGIEYSRAKGVSKEILIPLDHKEPPQLFHLRSLGEIRMGDTVSVEYQEQYTEDDEGTRSDFKRMARRITLVRRATEGTLRSAEAPNE